MDVVSNKQKSKHWKNKAKKLERENLEKMIQKLKTEALNILARVKKRLSYSQLTYFLSSHEA